MTSSRISTRNFKTRTTWFHGRSSWFDGTTQTLAFQDPPAPWPRRVECPPTQHPEPKFQKPVSSNPGPTIQDSKSGPRTKFPEFRSQSPKSSVEVSILTLPSAAPLRQGPQILHFSRAELLPMRGCTPRALPRPIPKSIKFWHRFLIDFGIQNNPQFKHQIDQASI